MVGLNFLLWTFICHVSTFATVETGSFCLAAIHFSLTGFVGLGIGPLLRWGLSFAFISGHQCASRLAVGILFLWCKGFAARSLASIAAFIASSSVHGGVIAFCQSYHQVPGIIWPELGLNIAQ